MITVNDGDPTPTFEQIRRQLADEIRSNKLPSGHKLPSVRQLAGDLRIAAGTVARAYAELGAEGLVATSRTGTRVNEVEAIPAELRRAARRYLAELGDTELDDALRIIRVEWEVCRDK